MNDSKFSCPQRLAVGLIACNLFFPSDLWFDDVNPAINTVFLIGYNYAHGMHRWSDPAGENANRQKGLMIGYEQDPYFHFIGCENLLAGLNLWWWRGVQRFCLLHAFVQCVYRRGESILCWLVEAGWHASGAEKTSGCHARVTFLGCGPLKLSDITTSRLFHPINHENVDMVNHRLAAISAKSSTVP